MFAPGELSSFDTRLQEDSHCCKKSLVIASSRQDRSLSRRKASQLARRCVGLVHRFVRMIFVVAAKLIAVAAVEEGSSSPL